LTAHTALYHLLEVRLEAIVKRAFSLRLRSWASNGFGEFILTGTNVGSYWLDIGSSLANY